MAYASQTWMEVTWSSIAEVASAVWMRSESRETWGTTGNDFTTLILVYVVTELFLGLPTVYDSLKKKLILEISL